MKVSIEQVEKLRERTNVTYEEARDALQAADGDILEAVISLEKEGKTTSSTAAYSTNNSLPSMNDIPNNAQQNNNQNFEQNGQPNSGNFENDSNNNQNQNDNQNQNTGSQANGQYNNGQNYYQNSGQYNNGQYNNGQYNNGQNYQNRTTTFGDVMRKIFDFCGKIIHSGNINHFQVHRYGVEVMSMPVTLLVLLLIVIFPITISVLIIALFFGCKYSFRGPDLGKEEINKAMHTASDVADDLKESFKTTDNSRYEAYKAETVYEAETVDDAEIVDDATDNSADNADTVDKADEETDGKS